MGKISKSYLKEIAERKKYQSGGFSTEGYKRNSPDVNNPYNVIPSNQITMKGVDFPVLGVDNFGNRQLMEPGSDYTFPGNYVKEFPMRNMGNNRFQDGGAKSPVILPQIDYDLEKAPKQGNFLLSDIDRPFYIDDEGWKRSEYRMGVNVDGKETLIPTVVNGTQLTEDQAIQRYYDTGLHMGQYDTVPESEYASRMRTLKYNMLEDPVRFDTNYQTGGTKKPIPRYVENRYGYNNTTDNTYVRPYTPIAKPVSAQQVKPKALQIPPTPVDRYRKQVDNTAYNSPVKTLRETYETPGQIMKEWEREERINNILTKVDNDIIPALDVTTDLMQTGNFVPHPIGQAVGKIGNAVGSLVDLYQFGRNLYDEEYGDATLNLASAILPGFLGQSTFRRNSKYLKPGQPLYPLSPQAGILPGGYSRVSYIEPFNRVRGMSAKNLLANRALLGTLGAETLYDMGVMSPKPIYNQFEGARDNVQINNVNRNNLYTLDRGQFYQTGGTKKAKPIVNNPKHSIDPRSAMFLQTANVSSKTKAEQEIERMRTAIKNAETKPAPVPVSSYYQEQPTQDNLRTEFYKKSDSDYATIAAAGPRVTPADLLRQWENEAEAEADKKEAQRLKAEREAAAKTKQAVEDWGDENAKFTFPDGKTKAWKDMDWREQSYVSAKNLGSWNAGNWTDNVNPVAMLGSWAEGLGSAPYVARETDSVMPYVTGIGGPLLAGALGGLGTKSTGQFVNNLANPLAGIVDYNMAMPGSSFLKKQVKGFFNSPRVEYYLQNKRIPTSIKNITVGPGTTQGKILHPNLDLSTQMNRTRQFLTGLESGAESLDQSVAKRIQDLESPEGFRRLVNQEKEYLESINYRGDLESAAQTNAKARIHELRNFTNINKLVRDYKQTNFIGPDNPFVRNQSLFNNAYYQQPSRDLLGNDLYIPNTNLPFTFSKKDLSFLYPQLGSKSIPGRLAMGHNYIKSKPIEMHEVAHAIQRGRYLPFDAEIAQGIIPKEKLTLGQKNAYDYFIAGREPSAFLNELRESMLQKWLIPDYYTSISPQQIQTAYKYFKRNPMGVLSPEANIGNKFLSNTRIFDFMAPTEANYSEIARLLNKAPAILPYALPAGLGIGALQQYNQEPKESYQMGGTIGIPGVNGQVVSSGSYPLASVKKTRGSVKKDNKGNVKTMSNQQVKQVLKYSKQKPNKI